MSKKQVSIIAEKIHLIKLDVVQQKIDNVSFKKTKEHQLKIGHKFMYNIDDERTKIELYFSFEDNKGKQLLLFQIDSHYQIGDLNNYYEIGKNKEPVFEMLFIATLLGISLSTSRGIIFEKLQNSGIENVIIPVVDPQKILMQKMNK